MIYVLLNPLSNNKKGKSAEAELCRIFENEKITFKNILEIENVKDFCKNICAEDKLIVSGGDGTLSNFVHDVYGLNPEYEVYLYASGSGNDFMNDVHDKCEIKNRLIPLNVFMKSLPEVTVNGLKRRFINGIGFGIDGSCCQESDRLRRSSDRKVNYTLIALKILLFKYKTNNATVTVDGESRKYTKVWLAPTMLGRFYGGGMMIAPGQNRLNQEKVLTNVVCHDATILRILSVFPGIYKGLHEKHTDVVDFRTGHEITVEFDKPQALQIDGETFEDVTSYSVRYGLD